jgi:hypothetical protein
LHEELSKDGQGGCNGNQKFEPQENKKERTMSNVTRKLAGEVGRLLLAYLLIFSQGAWAARDAKPTDAAKPAQKMAVDQSREKPSSAAGAAEVQTEKVQGERSENATSAEKVPGDGKHEGIKVHGHWAIDVKNPDGTLVTHREFENSLNQSYPTLSSFLSRKYSVGTWFVVLNGNVCVTPVGTPIDCTISEPAWGIAIAGNQFSNLSVTNNGNVLVLSGTATAVVSGSIADVQTVVEACPATTPTSSPCSPNGAVSTTGATGFGFTNATLATPIQVSAGQTIAVTVTISFS